jgi:hypothetical protein
LAITTGGRLEVFAAGPDGTLGHMYQTVPGSGPWSKWEDLGPAIYQSAAVFQNADGRLEVFAPKEVGTLGHTYQTAPGSGPWSAWADLGAIPGGGPGAALGGAPAVFQTADGRLEVFAVALVDADIFALGTTYQTYQTEWPFGISIEWSEWRTLGPEFEGSSGLWTAAPAVFQNADGLLEVFAAGPDGTLGHTYQRPGSAGIWSAWADLGPAIQGLPAVFQNADGLLEVFAAGPDGTLGHMYQTAPDNGWSEWGSLGPLIQGPPTVFHNPLLLVLP